MMGALFAFGGFVLMDGGMLALGNIFLLVGTAAVLGPSRLRALALDRRNIAFNLFLLVGLALTLRGSPRTGILLELVGLYYLLKSVLLVPVRMLRSVLGL